MIKNNLKNDLLILFDFLSNQNNTNKTIILDSFPTNNYLSLDSIKDKYKKSIITNIIYKIYIDCHKKSYGSGDLLLKHIKSNSQNLKEYIDIVDNNSMYNLLLSHIEYTENENISFNREIIKKYVDQLFTLGNNKVKEIVNYCIDNCDISTIFVVKKSNNLKYKITFEEGNKINFLNSEIITSDEVINSPYIVPIDGYIESVAEINMLLEQAAASKDNIIIFCRGAAEDVKTTIKLNQKRKTINLSLISVPLDEKHINTLKDIAIISNSDILSTHDGQEIRKINYKNFNRIDKVVVEKDDVIFVQSAKEHINNHINFLREKLIENELNSNSAIAELYKNRLQIFNSKQTIIEIPENDFSLIEISDLNSFFKRLINILKFGAITTPYGIFSERCLEVVNMSLKSTKELLLNSEYIIDNT